MANGIKIGNLDISAFKVGSADTNVYLGDTLLYPTAPPSFQGKWLATYSGGSTASADCDASSSITHNEITLTDLVSVEIGDCVTTIDNQVFSGCSSLTSCTIGSGVTNIGGSAFRRCTSLTNIVIPSSVTSIGDKTFQQCGGLTSITIEATTPPTLGGKYAFAVNYPYFTGCPIYVPSASVETYKSASVWSTYASRIQAIPS